MVVLKNILLITVFSYLPIRKIVAYSFENGDYTFRTDDVSVRGIDDNTDLKSFKITEYCPSSNRCVPLNECPEIVQDALTSCLLGDRTWFCGGTNYKPMVCCPTNVEMDKYRYCGKSLVTGKFYNGLGTYPFVARIGFKSQRTGEVAYPCTGSIISKKVILTAAHCALTKTNGFKLSSVRIGEYDTASNPDCVQLGFCAPGSVLHGISHVIVHPDYVAGQYHNDIALIVLKSPMNYTVATQKICLHPERTNLLVGTMATVIGWGKVSTKLERLSTMQHLTVPLASWDQCISVYGATGALNAPKSISGQWICAGGNGADACEGFGGAPLIIQENGLYFQIGILSFGSDDCGRIKVPSVYTSIAHFYDWIQENLPM